MSEYRYGNNRPSESVLRTLTLRTAGLRSGHEADITTEREEDAGLRNEETRGTVYVKTEITRIMTEVGLEQ